MSGSSANSAGLHLLSAGAMHRIVDEVLPGFARQSGQVVSVQFASSNGVKTQVLNGDRADVVITSQAELDALVAEGKVIGQSVRALARSPLGVAVRAGRPKPDLGSVDAFRRTLLNAKAIAYADPATGSPSANHFVKVLDRLGLAEVLEPKTKLIKAPPGTVIVVCDAVARGEAEIGIQQISEILGLAGVELAGPLPPELQHLTTFSAGIGAEAANPTAARALIEYLAAPAAASVVKACGMQPE